MTYCFGWWTLIDSHGRFKIQPLACPQVPLIGTPHPGNKITLSFYFIKQGLKVSIAPPPRRKFQCPTLTTTRGGMECLYFTVVLLPVLGGFNCIHYLSLLCHVPLIQIVLSGDFSHGKPYTQKYTVSL